MYPIIMRFLLQRPEVDTLDVPMLFASLYSASEEWRQERAWIVRFVADGMVGSEDWKILVHRHVWDLLATLFQTSLGDRSLRKGILEVRFIRLFGSIESSILTLYFFHRFLSK